MISKYLYVAIGVLILMLSGAGFLLKGAYQENAVLEMELETQKKSYELLSQSFRESKAQIEELLEVDRESAKEIEEVKKKAAEDQERVRKIAERKAALYEKLVNKDFQKTQDELRRVSE